MAIARVIIGSDSCDDFSSSLARWQQRNKLLAFSAVITTDRPHVVSEDRHVRRHVLAGDRKR